jgi:hypothetical protein
VTGSQEPLAVLLLPSRLEEFRLADHARDLLAIPRVVALEPPRARTRRLRRNTVTALQARRLRFPGQPRVLVLYEPGQYPLARALLGTHAQAELWYVRGGLAAERTGLGPGGPDEDLLELDELARARARQVMVATPNGDPRVENEQIRARLTELGVITHRPFVPGVTIGPGRATDQADMIGTPRLGWSPKDPRSGRRQFG